MRGKQDDTERVRKFDNWSAYDLFNFLVANEEIDENDTVDQWDRIDLLGLARAYEEED